METNESSYVVRFLINGEERTIQIDAKSAAAASEMARHQEAGDDDDFELIQVHLEEEDQGSPAEA